MLCESIVRFQLEPDDDETLTSNYSQASAAG